MRKFKGIIGALLAVAILASSFTVPVMAVENLPDADAEPSITEPMDTAEPSNGETEETEEIEKTQFDSIADGTDPEPEDSSDNGEEDLGQDEIQDENTTDADKTEIDSVENQESNEVNIVTPDEAGISPATDTLIDDAVLTGQLHGKITLKCDGEDVRGNVEVGKTLTVDTSLVTAPEGAVLSYQWFKEEDGTEEEIVGANEASYQTTKDDFGDLLFVVISSNLTSNGIGSNGVTVSRLCSVVVNIQEMNCNHRRGGITMERLSRDSWRYTDWEGAPAEFNLELASLPSNSEFAGWFKDDDPEPVSREPSFTFAFGEIQELTAKVTWTGENPAGVTISGGQGRGTAKVGDTLTAVLGNDIPEGEIFYQWGRVRENGDGSHVVEPIMEGYNTVSYTLRTEDENERIAVVVIIETEEGKVELYSPWVTVGKVYTVTVKYQFRGNDGGSDSGGFKISEETKGDSATRVFAAPAGNEVTLTACSKEGYQFTGWYEDGKCVETKDRLIYIFGTTPYTNLETRYQQIDTYGLTVSDTGIFTGKEGQGSGTAQGIRLTNNGTGHLNLNFSIVPDNEASQNAFILHENSMKVIGGTSETLFITASSEKAVGEYSARLIIEDSAHDIHIEKPLKLKVLSADAGEPVITAQLIGDPKKVKLDEPLPEMSVKLTYNYGKDEDGQDIIIKVSSNMIRNYNRGTAGKQTVTISLGNYNTGDLTFEVDVVNYVRSISYYDNYQYQLGVDRELKRNGEVRRHMADGTYTSRVPATDEKITFGQPDFEKLGTQETKITYTDNSDPELPISVSNFFRVHVKCENNVANPSPNIPSADVGTAALTTENGDKVDTDNVNLVVKGIETADQDKVDELIDSMPDVTEDNSMQMEIRLETSGGEKVQPDGNIRLWLPYPKDTNANYTFTLLHILGNRTENVTVTKENGGLRFTVSHLSPFVLTWQEGGSTPAPEPDEPDDNTSNNRPGHFFYTDDSDDDDSDNSSVSYTKSAAPAYGDGTSKNLRTKEVKATAISKAVKQKAAGKTAKLYIADNATISKAVVGKMTEPVTFMGLNYYFTLDPAKITEKLDIKLRVYPSAPRAQQTFEKYFKEPVAAISCAQRGSYGMRAYIDIKPDKLSNIDTSKPMYVFSWNPEKNSYKRVGTAILLKNGWIRCYTDRGYDLIISNSSKFTMK